MGADTKANTTVGGALERGYRASLEPLEQLGDAFGGVGAAAAIVKAAEPVEAQAARAGGVSMGADTKANPIWDGGALQLLEHTVPLDAARDNDSGGNVKPLAREVNLLCRLCALELVDLKRVPVHTAGGEACGECQRALT